jgi:ribose transport system ATP-binding protein
VNAAASLPRLKVEGLTKSFFGVRVLHDVSFAAQPGQVLGIVGENGSGKSTAMNVVTGVLPADSGTTYFEGKPFSPKSRRDSDVAGMAFIQQELNVFPNLSVAENLFLLRPPRYFGAMPFISRRRMQADARTLLQEVDLDVSPDVLAGTLSAGERQLIEIARALASDARLFIFDEPTSSLTAPESQRLFELIRRLKRRDVTVLYISHNLDDVLALSDQILVMRDGRIALQAPAASVRANDLVLAMVGRPIDALFPTRTLRTTEPAGTPVLEVTGVSEPGVLSDINLRVHAGEIVGIAGLMGSGRSELARVLFGLDGNRCGTVRLDGKTLAAGDVGVRLASGVAFLTEDRRHEGLMMDASVADNMALAALPQFASQRSGRVQVSRLLGAIRDIGQKLNLKSGDVRTAPARSLSGGNQQKVVLGRWLLREPRLFILDEPTRGVDVGAKHEIYRLLAQLADSGMALLVISSELEELFGLCDQLHVMRRGEIVAQFPRMRFDREAILRAAFGQDRAA